MPKTDLHIIAFDVPYPPDYGGAIDVYYKIKALHEAGIRVHLHCFEYGRKKDRKLELICAQVYYYKRWANPLNFLKSNPFIVESRKNSTLLKRLIKMPFPILFEGLHTCAWLAHPALAKRQKIVRTHNVEHEYYSHLARATSHILKRQYYKTEARKLKTFEPIVKNASQILAISKLDQNHFKRYQVPVLKIFPFHADPPMNFFETRERFALYHGNLCISENIQALRFILTRVLPLAKIPMIVAGKGANAAIKSISHHIDNLRIYDAPDSKKMMELAQNAQVHLLPSFGKSGFKLKLLFALYAGGHVLVNSSMLHGTDLQPFCHRADTASEFASLLKSLGDEAYTRQKFEERKSFLLEKYSNRINAAKIINLLLPITR